MTKPNGMVLYEGPSKLTGAPVVEIATFKTHNRKTGDMYQIWTMAIDTPPHVAVKTGADESVCGTCPLRPSLAKKNGNTPCYVLTWQAPRAIWNAYKAGRYLKYDPGVFAGRKVRFGAYGSPAATPRKHKDEILKVAAGHIGYYQEWREFPEYKDILMASVTRLETAEEAQARGFNTFRSAHTPQEAHAVPGEVNCPASKEAGAKLNCAECLRCSGSNHNGKGVWIKAH